MRYISWLLQNNGPNTRNFHLREVVIGTIEEPGNKFVVHLNLDHKTIAS
jgi:hypothetical protein